METKEKQVISKNSYQLNTNLVFAIVSILAVFIVIIFGNPIPAFATTLTKVRTKKTFTELKDITETVSSVIKNETVNQIKKRKPGRFLDEFPGIPHISRTNFVKFLSEYVLSDTWEGRFQKAVEIVKRKPQSQVNAELKYFQDAIIKIHPVRIPKQIQTIASVQTLKASVVKLQEIRGGTIMPIGVGGMLGGIFATASGLGKVFQWAKNVKRFVVGESIKEPTLDDLLDILKPKDETGGNTNPPRRPSRSRPETSNPYSILFQPLTTPLTLLLVLTSIYGLLGKKIPKTVKNTLEQIMPMRKRTVVEVIKDQLQNGIKLIVQNPILIGLVVIVLFFRKPLYEFLTGKTSVGSFTSQAFETIRLQQEAIKKVTDQLLKVTQDWASKFYLTNTDNTKNQHKTLRKREEEIKALRNQIEDKNDVIHNLDIELVNRKNTVDNCNKEINTVYTNLEKVKSDQSIYRTYFQEAIEKNPSMKLPEIAPVNPNRIIETLAPKYEFNVKPLELSKVEKEIRIQNDAKRKK
jgi:hypothetical protein